MRREEQITKAIERILAEMKANPESIKPIKKPDAAFLRICRDMQVEPPRLVVVADDYKGNLLQLIKLDGSLGQAQGAYIRELDMVSIRESCYQSFLNGKDDQGYRAAKYLLCHELGHKKQGVDNLHPLSRRRVLHSMALFGTAPLVSGAAAAYAMPKVFSAEAEETDPKAKASDHSGAKNLFIKGTVGVGAAVVTRRALFRGLLAGRREFIIEMDADLHAMAGMPSDEIAKVLSQGTLDTLNITHPKLVEAMLEGFQVDVKVLEENLKRPLDKDERMMAWARHLDKWMQIKTLPKKVAARFRYPGSDTRLRQMLDQVDKTEERSR